MAPLENDLAIGIPSLKKQVTPRISEISLGGIYPKEVMKDMHKDLVEKCSWQYCF